MDGRTTKGYEVVRFHGMSSILSRAAEYTEQK